VLASLAIPRFTEASAKAKIAEAPRVLASYESAMLASVAELSKEDLEKLEPEDLVFEIPESKWFTYEFGKSEIEDNDGNKTTVEKAGACQGTAKAAMGSFGLSDYLKTAYAGAVAAHEDENGKEVAAVKDGFKHTSNNPKAAKKMVPNFNAEEDK